MLTPRASRPYWPDVLISPPEDASNLKPWSWALERSNNRVTIGLPPRPDRRPHLMLVWGIWWRDAFWFSTGPRTRKARNIFEFPNVVIGTEKADEALILEGIAERRGGRRL